MDQHTEPAVGDVLVVDDDPMIIALLTELLADEGYSVLSACNGLAAWEAIKARPPALLLTDIRMPFMAGDALVRRLRAAGYAFPVVVVAATLSMADSLWKLDRIAFIAKPFEVETSAHHSSRRELGASLTRRTQPG